MRVKERRTLPARREQAGNVARQVARRDVAR